MPFTIVPTRTTADPNSAADVNTLMENSTFTKSSRNRVDGLLLSNSPGDTPHDITIAAGICKDSTFVYTLELTLALTKRIDAAWSAGDNGGFLDTGSVAINTQYAVWLIRKDSDGTSDAIASTSFTSPSMPGGYTYKRLLRGFATDGSANIVNNQWLITDVVNDRSASIILYDQKAQNTAGDAYAAGAWRTRVINTININEIPGAGLLSANQVTLPAGTYTCDAYCCTDVTSGRSNLHRLYNITAGSAIEYGISMNANATGNKVENLLCQFTLAATSALEIQLYTTLCTGGTATNFGVEKYLQAHFQKIG